MKRYFVRAVPHGYVIVTRTSGRVGRVVFARRADAERAVRRLERHPR